MQPIPTATVRLHPACTLKNARPDTGHMYCRRCGTDESDLPHAEYGLPQAEYDLSNEEAIR